MDREDDSASLTGMLRLSHITRPAITVVLLLVLACNSSFMAGASDPDPFDDALAALGALEDKFEGRKQQVLHEVPFFSLNLPLEVYMDREGTEDAKAAGAVTFSFFEPRYVAMARQIEDGSRVYAYADSYPPKKGGLGTIVDVHDLSGAVGQDDGPAFKWLGPRTDGPVVVRGLAGPRFRISSVSRKPAPASGEALYVGKVVLLEHHSKDSAGDQEVSRENMMKSMLLSMGVVVEEDEDAKKHSSDEDSDL